MQDLAYDKFRSRYDEVSKEKARKEVLSDVFVGYRARRNCQQWLFSLVDMYGDGNLQKSMNSKVEDNEPGLRGDVTHFLPKTFLGFVLSSKHRGCRLKSSDPFCSAARAS